MAFFYQDYNLNQANLQKVVQQELSQLELEDG